MTQKQWKAVVKELSLSVRSLEECARSDFHLCSTKRNPQLKEYESVCAECGRPIFFTQLFPKNGPQPKKVCPECALKLARGETGFSA